MLPSPPTTGTLLAALHDPGHGASVGLPAEMASSADRGDDYIDGGLASLGIEVDETERAVIGGAYALFWPGIVELLTLELGEVDPEPDVDLSRSPR